ncbi:Conserved_hypothetical protein [Hexamita inflata]|uniref:Uncharacterized protein n=1 Tax=Hexamita inflata TaxID=28002 RepID=A0AA86PHA4_9EUKA|nr:Conserved hypothetical protein [Hexamita inflata]
MTNTFSALGSWVSWHNPRGWFMFSIGLFFMLFTVLPQIPYQHSRINYVNKPLSYIVSTSLFLGCLCFSLVVFFPVVDTSISGGKVMFSDVHINSALAGGAIFIFSYFILFILVVVDNCKKKLVFGPAFTSAMIILVIFFAIALIANVARILKNIGDSSFTFYSFSMWENLGIYIVFVFFVTTPFFLQQRKDGKFTVQNESKRLFPLIERIQLKTELSKIWFQIIKKNNCVQRWKQCRFLEYMADYQQVEGLVDDEIVRVLYQIADIADEGEECRQRILQMIQPFSRNPSYDLLKIAADICKPRKQQIIPNRNEIVIVQE